MAGLHVVFGTGAIGQRTAQALVSAGERVRAVNRSGVRPEFLPAEAELVTVDDASDAEQAAAAAAGASVVYQCLNAPYHQWAELFPPLQRAVLSAAMSNGARLVSIENLYGLGRVDGPMTERTPLRSVSHKGDVRAQMTQELLGASERGDVELAIGRASDYYGPGATNSAFGARVFEPLVAGKKVPLLGSADVAHSYAYIEDIGRGLATLGTDDRAFGHVWMLPHPPAETTRAFLAPAFAAAGKPERIGTIGPLMMRVGGLFIPDARESVEMLYEFTEPFVVDSSAITAVFGIEPTPPADALRRTVEWYAQRA